MWTKMAIFGPPTHPLLSTWLLNAPLPSFITEEAQMPRLQRAPNEEVFSYQCIHYHFWLISYNFSGIPVNTSLSVVHVPTNVFDGDPKVANAIDWSQWLDSTFKDNYNRDPSLSWQYFGSSTGFMRQYPAMKWMTSEHDPDLYDARMRDW